MELKQHTIILYGEKMREEKEYDKIVGRVKEIILKNRTPYYDECIFLLDNNIKIYCNFHPKRIKVGDKVRLVGEVKDGLFRCYSYRWLNPQTTLF